MPLHMFYFFTFVKSEDKNREHRISINCVSYTLSFNLIHSYFQTQRRQTLSFVRWRSGPKKKSEKKILPKNVKKRIWVGGFILGRSRLGKHTIFLFWPEMWLINIFIYIWAYNLSWDSQLTADMMPWTVNILQEINIKLPSQ